MQFAKSFFPTECQKRRSDDFFSTDFDVDDDVGDYIYVDEEESYEELPTAQPLVRDSDYVRAGGPNPSWFQRGREGGRHGNVDKFFTINGNPFWPFGFGGGSRKKPRAPPRDSGQKKILVGDSGLCGTGSCEFVLFCMVGGGRFTGGCGGLLYGCCERPDTLQSHQVAHKVREKQKVRQVHSQIFPRKAGENTSLAILVGHWKTRT